jgi:hypothetical protein
MPSAFEVDQRRVVAQDALAASGKRWFRVGQHVGAYPRVDSGVCGSPSRFRPPASRTA